MRLFRLFAGIAASLCLALTASLAHAQMQQDRTARSDIVNTAKSEGEFSIFVDALQRTGLDKQLEQGGPYTVFAPTDEAFKKLGQQKLDDLMKPENKDTLAAILKHHIISGEKKANQLPRRPTELAALDRENLTVERKNGRVRVEDATVTKADVEATNGVIHGVDTVIQPK